MNRYQKALVITVIKIITLILAICLANVLLDLLETWTGDIGGAVIATIAVCGLLWILYQDSIKELEDK